MGTTRSSRTRHPALQRDGVRERDAGAGRTLQSSTMSQARPLSWATLTSTPSHPTAHCEGVALPTRGDSGKCRLQRSHQKPAQNKLLI